MPKLPISPDLQALRRLLSGQAESVQGASAVEFAILAPILVFLLVCTLDLGLGFHSKMQVQNAAQAGAQYAIVNGFNATAISSAVTATTTLAGITASPAPSQFCGCPSNTGV